MRTAPYHWLDRRPHRLSRVLNWRVRTRGDVADATKARGSDHALAEVLSEFARTMLTEFPIQGILDHLVGRIVEIMPVTGAGVTLIAPGSGPHYVAASNRAAMRFEQLQSDLADGPCLAAYQSGEAVLVPDLRKEARFGRFAPLALEAGLAAVFTFPLRQGESRLGALDLYRDRPGALAPAGIRTAQTLADVAAAYLLNARARTDLQDAADRSLEASLHDPLTGLPNRTLMLERLEHASRRGERSLNLMALFFVDLDRFKAVNDTYGHQIGDELLIAVAARLQAELRPGDTLSRMSGDEFLILCEDLANPAQAEAILARIEAVLAPPFTLSSGTPLSVTASIGTAVTTPGGEPPEELIHHADVAMYRMKRRTLGTSNALDVGDVSVDRATLAAALPGALARGELHLDYQPIVDAAHARITSVEALLRWAHPTRGLVPPSLVIPIAEQTGAILEIGEWVLRQAWGDRHAWSMRDRPAIGVSVNVSPHQFMASGFADMVARVLLSGVSDPAMLTLEVTESALIHDTDRAADVLKALKGLGVTLALDDFGTGYCSLSQIMDYPVDTVKVDQRFVAGLAAATASETIVSAVIDLAHRFDMTVIAEGVETAGQHRALAALGTDACQGFYFARPMSAASLDTLIAAGSAAQATRLPLAE